MNLDSVLFYFNTDPVLDLGDLNNGTFKPDSIKKEGSYVKFTGITSNRAAKITAGLPAFETEYHFYTVLGGNILVCYTSTPSDPMHKKSPGSFKQVNVHGRAIKLVNNESYAALIKFYKERARFDLTKQQFWIVFAGEKPFSSHKFLIMTIALLGIIVYSLFGLFRRR